MQRTSGESPRLTPLEQRLYYGLIHNDERTVNGATAQQRLGVTSPHANKLLHDLNSKGVLQRVGRGRYLVSPPQSLAAPHPFPDILAALDQLMAPISPQYYVAYHTAAFLHGLADQIPFAVSVAVPQWRRPIELQQGKVVFHQVPTELMWGLTRLRYSDSFLTVSDPWRTLLDCASRLDLIGGVDELINIVRETLKPPHPSKPRPGGMGWLPPPPAYAQQFPDPAAIQRLGYILKLHEPEPGTPAEVFQNQLRQSRSPRLVLLDPTGPAQGRLDLEWGVQDNVPRARLQVA